MGFLSDITGGLFGGSGREAAGKAAAAQREYGQRAIGTVKDYSGKALNQYLKFERGANPQYNPYIQAGKQGLEGLSDLITDPNAQRNYIENNPFYGALADDAQRRIFSSAARRGKVGSGGTAKALQNSLLLLGNDLLSQNIDQRFNLANVGQNAVNALEGFKFNTAINRAGTLQNTGANIANLYTQIGNTQAAGQVGRAEATSRATGQLLNAGAAAGQNLLMLSDRRFKRNVTKVGATRLGIPVYLFQYRHNDAWHVGVMADEAAEVAPGATISIGGIQMVNYGRIA